METFWLFVFMGITILILFLLPFTIFYYEADDGQGNKRQNRFCEAVKLEILTLIVVGCVLALTFSMLAETSIPVSVISHDTLNLQPIAATLTSDEISSAKLLDVASAELIMKVPFAIYITALLGFVGWFAFVIFGGIGLVALPLDCILAFVYRPKFIPADIYAQQKIALQGRAAELIDLGRKIKEGFERVGASSLKQSLWDRKKQKKLDKITMNQFKQSVYLLEQDIEELNACHVEFKQHNPLIPFAKLLVGCVCTLLSLLWILQISIVMLIPDQTFGGFLSDYFIWFDRWFALFGTISVGLFSIYLLAAVVKGCFKFGIRCFCCSVQYLLHLDFLF